MEKEQEEQGESVESLLCPSFSTYSSNNLHHIADQVTREDDHSRPQNDNDENDFEFVAFRKAADEVFFDGHASHVFPIFNRDLLTERRGGGGGGGGGSSGAEDDDAAAIRIPLGKLLIGGDERGPDPPSSSSSEVEDDLEAIPAGTYCVWTPKPVQASPSRCKKSNSTGSSSSSPSSASKRWKLLSLLRRSKSDGKESLVVLTPSPKKGAAKGENSKEQRGGGRAEGNANRVAGKKIPATEKKNPVSAHEGLYGRKRETRRRSYLPYREDLFGFGVSLNPIGKGFPLHF